MIRCRCSCHSAIQASARPQDSLVHQCNCRKVSEDNSNSFRRSPRNSNGKSSVGNGGALTNKRKSSKGSTKQSNSLKTQPVQPVFDQIDGLGSIIEVRPAQLNGTSHTKTTELSPTDGQYAASEDSETASHLGRSILRPSAPQDLKAKLSRLVVPQPNPLADKESLSHSSSSTFSTNFTNEGRRRSSLSWSKRVSVNTPIRRASEHEVGWVDQDDPDVVHSSSSEEEDDKSSEDLSERTRKSVVVSMQGSIGGRISFTLEKLNEEMRDYLNQVQEEERRKSVRASFTFHRKQ
ncbi:unnamed protein product [Calicophoron daubneyi]|uniref:Uncharacterized protein n=1 Tax=Calicophoron daubneyi TaxID=300641 RepID=A0AAV2TTR2_CALDB